jgi:5-formyltetrahydrofolate cyclo-ligase
MTKQACRNLYKQLRQNISDAERMDMDDALLQQMKQLSFVHLQLLFTYWPMAHTAEPNTLLFTKYLKDTNAQLELAYPVVVANTMQAVRVFADTTFKTSAWGITEPVEGELIDAKSIDISFVPLLIFDMKGNRVGYGKGYYDKFLAICRKDMIKIGFSYFEPIDEIEDVNTFDIPLNYCITPERIYEF